MNANGLLTPEALPAGADGVLLRFALTPRPEAMAAAALMAAELERDPPEGVVEIAPSLTSLLMRFDPAKTRRAALMREGLERATCIARSRLERPEPARRWTIPVAFGGTDGPQLGDVANTLGQSEDSTIRQLCKADLRVLAIGFAPGQPYIGLLPEAWNLPRLTDLTPAVPAGAVVVAVRQIVMFGADSATGWRQLGRAAFRTFRPEREPPMPLRAGDAIRYVPASASDIADLAGAPDGLGGARLDVLR